MAQADLIIRNATLFDGTDTAATHGDLAVSGDRICAIGDLKSWKAEREIDAAGLALAPGFIDTHTHDDRALLGDRTEMLCKVSQGVTTVIVGNCGVSLAPLSLATRPVAPLDLLGDETWWVYGSFAAYRDALQSQPPAVNALALVGHISLRVAVMGNDLGREANAAEVAAMRAMLTQALSEGAGGLSTGLAYPPAAAATTAEVIGVGDALGRFGGLYVTHLRDEGAGVIESIEEALTIGRTLGCSIVLSHHKCAAPENFGRSRETLALIEKSALHQKIDLDAYPYAASSTALLVELLRDDIPVQVTWSLTEPSATGRMLSDIAAEWGVSCADAARRLQPAGAVYFSMEEADVRRILAHPRTMIGSDGLPHDERPHPRLWGTFPRVLGHYARDEALFSLETAVHKMTGLPAKVFGLRDRGELQVGAFADLVLFDPGSVIDRATYTDPVQPSAGIAEVWVNGVSSYRPDAGVTAGAGRLLTRSNAAADQA